MVKTLYLHIGMQKTATTYIQQLFRDNNEVLGESGIYYPLAGQNDCGTHLGLSSAMFYLGDDDKKLLKTLKNEIKDKDNILISSENFSFLLEKIEFIKDFFADYDVKIICSIRKHSEFLYSIWQTFVRTGEVLKPFNSYILPFFMAPLASIYFNYAIILDSFSAVFGKNSIFIIPFGNESIETQFKSILSLKSDFIKPKNIYPNAKYDEKQAEFIRIMKLLTQITKCKIQYIDRVFWRNRVGESDLFKYFEKEIFEKYKSTITISDYCLSAYHIRKNIYDKYKENIYNGCGIDIFRDLNKKTYSYLDISIEALQSSSSLMNIYREFINLYGEKK